MKSKSVHAKIFMPQRLAQSYKPLENDQPNDIKVREEVYWDRNSLANKNK